MDVPDMDAVMAAMKTEAAADAMAHDGVLPETLVTPSRRNPATALSLGVGLGLRQPTELNPPCEPRSRGVAMRCRFGCELTDLGLRATSTEQSGDDPGRRPPPPPPPPLSSTYA